ncbi:MAG: HDOD domain-containing protein [Nocardioidaceae bacterium]
MTHQLHEGAQTQPEVERVVARQPIISRNGRIIGFQLIQRTTAVDDVPHPNADDMVSVSALLGDMTVSVDALVGNSQLFCRPGPWLLTGTPPMATLAGRTVLEVPARLCGDPQVIERCRAMLGRGYALALDEFGWYPGIEALLELADAVEIDLAINSREHVLGLVERLRPYDVPLLAARCLTEDDLAWAGEVGFELFHGPAIQRPVQISGASLAPSALTQVQLATELLDEDLDFNRIEAILNHDPALVVQVLRQASLGAGGGLRREVHSVREALVLMGTTRLRRWAALAVLGRQVDTSRSDALAVALVRARMCELRAQQTGIDRGFAFTAGLLSALDLLLSVDISEIEARVDVDEGLAAAAFRREGPVGELVSYVADYQSAVAAGEATGSGIGDVELVAAMAFAWAMSHVNAMLHPPRVA